MRVCLSSIRPEDSEILFRWVNDPETVRFNAPYRPVHWASYEEWVRAIRASPGRQVFAIRVDGRAVGVVQLVDIDPVHRSAELTIRIGEEADRGRGTGTAALRLATDFAWRDLNLHRVWVRVFATNAQAIRAYEKAGFVAEGRLREAAQIDGRYVDIRVFGMIRPRGETRRSGAGGAFLAFRSLSPFAGALLQECCSKACGKSLNFHESGCGGSPARGAGIGQRDA